MKLAMPCAIFYTWRARDAVPSDNERHTTGEVELVGDIMHVTLTLSGRLYTSVLDRQRGFCKKQSVV